MADPRPAPTLGQPCFVLTVDQRGSRRGPDRIPGTLATLADLADVADVAMLLPFERTVGDEFQGLVDDPESLPHILEQLLREDAWNIGIGVGAVDRPLPDHARAGRGPAYLHAREAVTAAKSSPWHLRVVGDDRAARHLETTLWLWAAVLARRTTRGWEVADLVAEGLSYDETGRRLGITASAVSQRAQAAGIVEARRARELVADLARGLLGKENP
jgi:hypothetical protein